MNHLHMKKTIQLKDTILLFLIQFTAHPELAGMTTQKLFNSESSISTIGGKEYTFSYKYEYGFDEDGYVNKAIVKHNEEDCEHILSEYTFVWE